MAKLFIDKVDISSRTAWFYVLLSNAQIEIYEFNENNEELDAENPMKIVPFLMDGNIKVWGSQACILYIAERYGDFERFGMSYAERARMESLLSWASNSLFRNVARDFVAPTLYEEEALEGANREIQIEQGKKSVQQQLDVMEMKYLKSSEYISGNEIHFSDYFITMILSVLDKVDFDFSKWPNTCRWYDTMKEKVSQLIQKFQEK